MRFRIDTSFFEKCRQIIFFCFDHYLDFSDFPAEFIFWNSPYFWALVCPNFRAQFCPIMEGGYRAPGLPPRGWEDSRG
jgi:hypothetical protein